jgi:hypothetical protein
MFRLPALGFSIVLLIAILIGLGRLNSNAPVSSNELRSDLRALVTAIKP